MINWFKQLINKIMEALKALLEQEGVAIPGPQFFIDSHESYLQVGLRLTKMIKSHMDSEVGHKITEGPIEFTWPRATLNIDGEEKPISRKLLKDICHIAKEDKGNDENGNKIKNWTKAEYRRHAIDGIKIIFTYIPETPQ